MKTFIVRFKCQTKLNLFNETVPNIAPRLIAAPDKETARANATKLAAADGLEISSVRTYFATHDTKDNMASYEAGAYRPLASVRC